jgi:hypothetical protein
MKTLACRSVARVIGLTILGTLYQTYRQLLGFLMGGGIVGLVIGTIWACRR